MDEDQQSEKFLDFLSGWVDSVLTYVKALATKHGPDLGRKSLSPPLNGTQPVSVISKLRALIDSC